MIGGSVSHNYTVGTRKKNMFYNSRSLWKEGLQEDYKDIFENSPMALSSLQGKLIEGVVIAIKEKVLVIDLGLKMPIKFPLDELPKEQFVKVGDCIQFIIDTLETHDGEMVLNYEKAQKEIKQKTIWNTIQNNKDHINGIVLNHVDGGYSVGFSGIVAFLPKDQVLPIKYKRKHRSRGKNSFVGSLKTFYVLNVNSSKSKKNIIVSRTEAIKEMLRVKKEKELY